jgi:hypothetical protein
LRIEKRGHGCASTLTQRNPKRRSAIFNNWRIARVASGQAGVTLSRKTNIFGFGRPLMPTPRRKRRAPEFLQRKRSEHAAAFTVAFVGLEGYFEI